MISKKGGVYFIGICYQDIRGHYLDYTFFKMGEIIKHYGYIKLAKHALFFEIFSHEIFSDLLFA